MSSILQSNIDYLKLSLEAIIETGNTGNLAAFQDNKRNSDGMLFNKDEFVAMFASKGIYINSLAYPDEFIVSLKYSPISLFKKWIMVISNQVLLKPTDSSTYKPAKPFKKEFFFYKQNKTQLYFYPIATNATHERFLINVYEKPSIVEQHFNFKTFFTAEKKLILYKNYNKRKVTSVFFDSKVFVQPGKLYTVQVQVNKKPYCIRYLVSVEQVGRNMPFEVWLHKDKEMFLQREVDEALHLKKIQAEANEALLASKKQKKSVAASQKEKKEKSSKTSSLNDGDNNTTSNSTNEEASSQTKSKLVKKDKPKKQNKVISAEELTKYRNEVIALIDSFSKDSLLTNKFGNISLGRIYKTPILINLSMRHKDMNIYLHYDDTTSLLSIKDKEDNLLKNFKLSNDPKSNWLESKF